MTSTLPPELARFIASTRIPITIAAPGGSDHELIVANAAFCELTGYSHAEVVGRDCRFLQGEATDARSRRDMRRFFEEDPAAQTRVSVVNYRKDGQPFVNLVFLSKLYSVSGAGPALRFLLASQFDISHATVPAAQAYDNHLGASLAGLSELGKAHRLSVGASLVSIAASAHAILSAKLALSEIVARAL